LWTFTKQFEHLFKTQNLSEDSRAATIISYNRHIMLERLDRQENTVSPEKQTATQRALRFKTPQIDSRVLDWRGVLPTLQMIAGKSPFFQLDEVPIPDPEILGSQGVRFYPIVTGVCGSDKKIVHLDMSESALMDVPNVPPENSSRFVRALRQLMRWNNEDGRILRPFTLGHEIVAMNERRERGVLYPIVSCEFKFDDPSEYCPHCVQRKQNLCQRLQEGPTRGLALGTGVITAEGKELGGGFSSVLVAYENQFILLPEGMSNQQAVLTDAYACAVNGVEMVQDYLLENKESKDILIIGLGAIGFSVMNRLIQLGIPAERITALVKNAHQERIVKHLGGKPLLLNGGKVVAEAASSVDARREMLTGKEYVISGGKGGFDVVFDCVGSRKSIHDSYWLTKPDGHFVELGLPDKIDDSIGRKQVQIHFPFWATVEQYRQALGDLQKIPEQCEGFVNTNHTLLGAKSAFFPQDRKYIKHAIKI